MDNYTQNPSYSLIVLPPLIFIALAGVLFYFMFYKPMNEKIARLERNKNYVDSTYLRKQGSTSTYGGGELGKDFINYDLRSWDGGKNWYAIDKDLPFKQNEVRILGTAEEVYPKLLQHLEAWDKLTEYAQKNGGVKDTKDSIGIELLKGAGFTVTKKEDKK